MVNAKTWNSAQIDQAIRRLEGIIRSGSYNPAVLNQLLNQLGEPGYINTWNPAELDQKLRTLLHDLLSWKTATGNPIQLRTNNGGLVQSCELSFSPIQDLHGYVYPWSSGNGKNKLPLTVDNIKEINGGSSSWSENSKVINNVTFTILTDTDNNVIGINVNGTASSQVDFYTINGTTFSPNTYILNGCPSGGSSSTFMLYNQVSGNSDYGEGSQFTISDGSQSQAIRIVIRSGYNAQNLVFKPMIRLSTETDATFAPYSNICQISGRDSLHLYQDTEQTETPETTYTATFPDTVYGGKWLPQEGKAYINKWYCDMGDLTYAQGDGYLQVSKDSVQTLTGKNPKRETASSTSGLNISEICPVQGTVNQFRFGTNLTKEEFEAIASGYLFVYELATPTEITLTAEQIELLKGNNVLFTEGDNIEITYKKLLLPSDVEELSKSKKIKEKPKTRSKKKKEE